MTARDIIKCKAEIKICKGKIGMEELIIEREAIILIKSSS